MAGRVAAPRAPGPAGREFGGAGFPACWSGFRFRVFVWAVASHMSRRLPGCPLLADSVSLAQRRCSLRRMVRRPSRTVSEVPPDPLSRPGFYRVRSARGLVGCLTETVSASGPAVVAAARWDFTRFEEGARLSALREFGEEFGPALSGSGRFGGVPPVSLPVLQRRAPVAPVAFALSVAEKSPGRRPETGGGGGRRWPAGRPRQGPGRRNGVPTRPNRWWDTGLSAG